MTDIVERLRADGGELTLEAAREIEHLRAVITLSEAELAITEGALRTAAREADEPFRVTELPPNTPR